MDAEAIALLKMILESLNARSGEPRRTTFGNPDSPSSMITPEQRDEEFKNLLGDLNVKITSLGDRIRTLSEQQEERDTEIRAAKMNTEAAIAALLAAREQGVSGDELAQIEERATELKEQENALRERLVAEIETELNATTKQLEAEQLVKQQYTDIFRTLTTRAKTQVNNFFGAMGVNYAGDPYHGNPWFIVIDNMLKGKDPLGKLVAAQMRLVRDQIENNIRPLNLIVNLMTKVKTSTIEMFMEFDRSTVSLMRMTGITEGASDALRETWGEIRYMAFSMQEAAEALGGLRTAFAGFSTLSTQRQQDFAVLAATVKRFGVSVEQSGKIFSFFTDTLKQGQSEVKGNFATLLGIAQNTGDSLSKIMADFAAVLPEISKYGNQAVNVFRGMEATAKALKIEVSELLQIGKGFDTFQTAAGHVGRLNAILGGPYLNTVQMLQMSEDERLQSLNQAFKATGRNFEALSRHEKQAIATAAGISDMNVATKVFGGSLSELNGFLRTNSINQAELEKRAERSASIMERFKSIMDSLAVIFAPILEAFHTVLKFFQGLGWAAAPAFFLFIGLAGKLTTSLMGLGASFFDWIGKLKSFAGPAKKAAEVAGSLGTGIGAATNPALQTQATGFFTRVGLGLKTFIASLAGLIGVAPAAAGVILLIGGAVAVVAGIFAAFLKAGEGIGKLFSGLGEKLKTDSLTRFVDSVGNVANDVPTKLDRVSLSISRMSAAISNVPRASLSGFSSIIEGIEDMADELDNELSIKFLSALSNFTVSVGNLKPESARIFQQFKTDIVDMSKELNSLEISGDILTTLQQISGLLNKNNQQQNQQLTANIHLDGQPIARHVIPLINNQQDIRK